MGEIFAEIQLFVASSLQAMVEYTCCQHLPRQAANNNSSMQLPFWGKKHSQRNPPPPTQTHALLATQLLAAGTRCPQY